MKIGKKKSQPADPIEEAAPDDAVFEDEGEFYDDQELAGEEFDQEDGWEEGDLAESENAAIPVGKKKKSKSNILVIGGGLAAGLVVLYMTMGGGGQAPQTAPQPSASQTASTATASAPPSQPAAPGQIPTQMDVIYGGQNDSEEEEKAQKAAAPKTGLMNDDAALNEIENIKESFVFEEYAVDEDEGPNETADSAALPSPAPMVTDMLTPLPGEVAAEEALAPPPATADAVDITPGASLPAAADLKKSSSGQNDPTLIAKVEEIADRLERIDTRLAAIEKTAAKKEDLSTLRTDLNKLETKLNQMGSKRENAAAPAAQEPPAKAPVKINEAAPAPDRSASAVSGAEWVLKAAQPGSALVSQKGQQEILTLRPGDTLPGIGKVQDIRLEDGKWVVVGTQGKIFQ